MWNDKGAPPDLPEAVTVLRMHNASLNNRWTRVGEHVHTDAVLNLDDDVFVNKQGLVCMYNWWSTHRSRLVGPFVRKHHGHGQHLEYSQDELFGRHDYSMVLPKVLMLTPTLTLTLTLTQTLTLTLTLTDRSREARPPCSRRRHPGQREGEGSGEG